LLSSTYFLRANNGVADQALNEPGTLSNLHTRPLDQDLAMIVYIEKNLKLGVRRESRA
jgi:hypothetical protein